jgi:ABC-type dipeptide/oligopeptide/nickel transport system permease subunit
MSDAASSPPAGSWLRTLPLRLRVMARHAPTAFAGALIVGGFALLALLAPLISPHDPMQANPYDVLKPPSGQFWFGTDGAGMDVFSRIIHGSRLAFGIAVPAVAHLAKGIGRDHNLRRHHLCVAGGVSG